MATHPTTVGAIRDRIITVIESLMPASGADVKFRAYRNEAGADFEAFAEKNPTAARRRFQVRDDGSDEPPEVSAVDVDENQAVFEIRVAYPQNQRDGAKGALDRDDTMREDLKQIVRAVGMHGKANFTHPLPDATWLSGSVEREQVSGIDYIVIRQTMFFQFQYP